MHREKVMFCTQVYLHIEDRMFDCCCDKSHGKDNMSLELPTPYRNTSTGSSDEVVHDKFVLFLRQKRKTKS